MAGVRVMDKQVGWQPSQELGTRLGWEKSLYRGNSPGLNGNVVVCLMGWMFRLSRKDPVKTGP